MIEQEPNGEVPEGWECVRLGDVTAPSAEKVEPSGCPDALYLSLEHIGAHTASIVGVGSASEVTSTKTVFRRGDVLYGKLRPYLNKVCVPDFDGICSTDILVFPRTEHLDSRYLMRCLMTSQVVDYAHHHSTGVQLPRVGWTEMAALELPLPPLAEQHRIVEKIDGLLSRASATGTRLARVKEMVKRFRQSVLAAACSGRLTADWRELHPETEPVSALLDRIRAERKAALGKKYREPEELDTESLPELPEGWEWSTLECLTPGDRPICYGILMPKTDVPDGVPYVRVKDIRGDKIDLSGIQRTSHEIAAAYARSVLWAGDVLVAIRGTYGRVAVVPPELQGGNITQDSARITPALGIDGAYLASVLRTESSQAYFREVARGVAVKGVNIGDLRLLPIPVPPTSEQQEIVRRADALLALADAIDTRVSLASVRSDKLTQAVLAKALRGELVPTEAELARAEGRDYEPASVLLERVRKEREKQPKAAARGQVERKPHMTKITVDSVWQVMHQLPHDSFTFDELRQRFSADYDTLKDVVFQLLGEEHPKLRQVFDPATSAMRFEKVKQ